MNRFSKVIAILDDSVGGSTSPAGPHGAFWRSISRDDFVVRSVFGLQLIEVGNGAASNLVKALKGEVPFDGSNFNRMPAGGLVPVSDDDIKFIEAWIDDGCPADNAGQPPVVPPATEPTEPETGLSWRPTSAPNATRYDDIWFVDPDVGWAVNSAGSILKTTDGGASWDSQFSAPGVYLRCVGFGNSTRGWVGTLTQRCRLLETSDGGANWLAVENLPDLAPVAACGMSVVNDQVVYVSGTNRPEDFPRMMKTTDGGSTWTAWDMSAHASILIDTWFADSMHGWVVGGKASEPTPTTRGKLKPVVLETTDGGVTWTNRIANIQDDFPFGEWGWKIQFINDNVGFVSLENLSDGAILKTTDGGQSWTRLKINDAQGNANLEGIGFIDENIGWVGGWGSASFLDGFSSSTTDGGNSWSDANEIGLFINRFRFFGDPVSVGYASGDTVYKYSHAPTPTVAAGIIANTPVRKLLPDSKIVGDSSRVSIRLEVPEGTKRFSLQVWDRFGVEVGTVLDEIRPTPGQRTFHWRGVNMPSGEVAPGQYLLRAIADDVSASSFVSVHEGSSGPARGIAPTSRSLTQSRKAKPGARRVRDLTPSRPRLATLSALMSEPTHDEEWLRNALQIAIQLELATLPPYLTARWSIIDTSSEVAVSIHEIRGEEMLHFGLACNLLVAIGGTPLLADASVVPRYPGPLPGGVRPGLEVALKKLTRKQARVFMDIEYPHGGPVANAGVSSLVTYDSLGEFYETVLAVFKKLNPTLDTTRQLENRSIGLTVIGSAADVESAIRLINAQGEGSSSSPYEAPGDLAHYYRFAEIFHGRRLIEVARNNWDYAGDPVELPAVYEMADIPNGGYRKEQVPDMATWDLVQQFDRQYSNMLRSLQSAWTHGNQTDLNSAVGQMFGMATTGLKLIKTPKPDGSGNYGPSFRFVE